MSTKPSATPPFKVAPDDDDDRRSFRRALLEITGTVIEEDGQSAARADCIVLDLSLTGAKIQIDENLISDGGSFQLELAKKLRIAAPVEFHVEVMWQSGPIAGLRFLMEPHDVARALEELLPPECMRFDTDPA